MKKLLIPAIIINLGIILFSFHDDFIYQDKIVKITKIETIEEDYDYNDLGIKETLYKEKITGIITNGKEKGKSKTYIHERTKSNVADERYYVGDKVIIKNGNIDTLKRDQYFITIAVLFILGLIVIGSFRGLLITISVFFNIGLLLILLELYQRNIPFTLSTILISIIYIVTSLYVASGKNKKTIAAILSVFLSQGILFIILESIAKITNFNGLNFNLLSYLTVPP
ncbi:MAG: YibE/F family protein, partial [Bacilli bacterium]|nr:YibE/F family protein [Bacilli bacterium]